MEWRGGDDAVSSDKDKPILNKLRRAVEDKEVLIDVLVVASWDRLARRGRNVPGSNTEDLDATGEIEQFDSVKEQHTEPHHLQA
ncbi:MAG: recombinase family protein [Planctomycetota bacterium]|nr:recombinase family protein [Planctomycetota bacterium]